MQCPVVEASVMVGAPEPRRYSTDMRPRYALSAVFLGAVAGSLRAGLADAPDLEARLVALVEEGSAAWPQIALPPEAFVQDVAARISAGRRAPTDLGGLRAADLFLACACARGDARAIASFEERFFADLAAALGTVRLSPARLDELKQVLRNELFLSRDRSPAGISRYAGTGDLRAWVRVTAVRASLKILREEKRHAPAGDEAMLKDLAGDDDPELSHMKQTYRPAFREAFQEALESLSVREQNLLRQHVVDRLSIDELGALYKVHRATAARWVEGAREALVRGVRQRFMKRVRVSRTECDSILRLVQSQLDATIRRRLEGA
jgi:RNA polymerase sigma-70 factor (ECF subfamily)